MMKKVLAAGLGGGIVMVVWLLASNAMLPYKGNMIHKIAPNQLAIHRVLKENLIELGTYTCPYLGQEEESLLPDYRNQPVYSIIYEGYRHSGEGAPPFLFPIVIPFVVALAASWMLSMTSERILSGFGRRFLFVALLGGIIALYDDILQISLGPQPDDYLIFLAVNNVITWALASLVIAWRMKPAVS
jgi:hypothetical protein